MNRGQQGQYVTTSVLGEAVRAYVPHPLPPDPPIEWSSPLRAAFDEALLALGRLDQSMSLLPAASLLLYAYVRKEAVLSSMIEGTQSSLADLLLFELDHQPGAPINDVEEVSSYVAALQHGLVRMKEGFPLSLRLIREIHGILLATGRGSKKSPGEFRTSQNWIGGPRPGAAHLVPPPADRVLGCMGDLERFLHDLPEVTPPLLKAALSHVQFETIHPFLDGNGRVGRLMITLILCEQGVLASPALYLSLYFKAHRETYYELLDIVRKTGDWEAWLRFFAEAVTFTANEAIATAGQLVDRAAHDRSTIESFGRAAPSCLQIHRALIERPIVTPTWLVVQTNLTPATVNRSLEQLERAGIVAELTSRKRNRIFGYDAFLAILNRGMELPE